MIFTIDTRQTLLARRCPTHYAPPMNYRVRLVGTDEGWSVSCLDLLGCHSQGATRTEALNAIREAIQLWIEVEAEENGIKSAETLELSV